MAKRDERRDDKQDLDFSQHWLVDNNVLSTMAGQVQRGARVLEIGAGKGQLTGRIAPVAKEVVAVEIDERFFPDLESLAKQHRNVKVMIFDAQRLDFGNYSGFQVIGDLPYHITEPFITRLAGAPISSATLMVGQRFAQEVTGKDEKNFGKLRMLVETFFNVHLVANVSKQSFDPPPRTESAILEFIPRDQSEFREGRPLFVARELFRTAIHSPQVKSAIREALIKFAKDQRGVPVVMTKNEARAIVDSLGLSDEVLDYPLEQLGNPRLLELDQALKSGLK